MVHRGLNPRSIAIRSKGNKLYPQVTDWDSAGMLPANPDTAVSRLSSGSLTLMAASPSEAAKLFGAPEGVRPDDPARIDVFGLGALAFFILTGGQSPATERGELLDRLRRDHGLDLAAEVPQIRSTLRQLVLDATNPSPAERTADVATFREQLAAARENALALSTETDPLEAGPGAELDAGRYLYKRKLGAGSTAVGILVEDRQAGGAERVLKVAKDFEAGDRLRAEAQVLGRFEDDERIVTLYHEVEVGGRTALLLKFAGRTTLAEELNTGRRLSIDVLQRWGTDLLTALTALERNGVTHRDIKPSNLGCLPIERTHRHPSGDVRLLHGRGRRQGHRRRHPALPRPVPGHRGSPPVRHRRRTLRRGGRALRDGHRHHPAVRTRPRRQPGHRRRRRDRSPRRMFESTIAAAMTQFFSAALSRDAACTPRHRRGHAARLGSGVRHGHHSPLPAGQ